MEAEGAADGHGADHAQRPKRAAAVAAAKRIYKVFAAFSSAESSTTRREASLRVPRSRLLLLQSGQRLAYRRRIDSPWRHRLHEVADLVVRCRSRIGAVDRERQPPACRPVLEGAIKSSLAEAEDLKCMVLDAAFPDQLCAFEHRVAVILAHAHPSRQRRVLPEVQSRAEPLIFDETGLQAVDELFIRLGADVGSAIGSRNVVLVEKCAKT